MFIGVAVGVVGGIDVVIVVVIIEVIDGVDDAVENLESKGEQVVGVEAKVAYVAGTASAPHPPPPPLSYSMSISSALWSSARHPSYNFLNRPATCVSRQSFIRLADAGECHTLWNWPRRFL